MLGRCSSWLATPRPHILSLTRTYAISVKPAQILPGKQLPRVFKDKKSFQYNSYTRILNNSSNGPLLFLHHKEFSAQRLVKLRQDIIASARSKPSLASPIPVLIPSPEPSLTVIRTSIFGAALRDFPNINLEEVDKMLNGTAGNFAVLSLPTFDPPQLSAILRAMNRGVPPRKPKTPEEIKKELEEKNADPETPGRRVKRMRKILHPELRLVGALIEGQVFLPESVRDVSTLPTLDTLRAQIVGLLSAPATQLAGVLSEASGGGLARTLEGLKKGLEQDASGSASAEPPTS
jgi:ribosomal protein L10